MTVTLGNILSSVKSGLRMFEDWGTAHATSDGVSSRFRLPDYPIIDVDEMLVLVEDDNEELQPMDSADYTVDTEAGWFTFDTPPTLKDEGDPDSGRQIQWTWRFRIYSDDEIIEMINSAVRFVGREFYIEGASDDTLVTDYDNYEYAAPVDAKQLLSVELRYDDSCPWTLMRGWRTRNFAGQLYVQFGDIKGDMQMRLGYIAKPVAFSLTDRAADPNATPPVTELLVLDQPLSGTGLPEDAYDPIVHYAVWQGFERRVNFRSRDDAAQHMKDETTVTMRDLEARASRLKTVFDLHYSQFRTAYPTGRLIG